MRSQPMLENTYVTEVTHEEQRRVLRHREDGCVERDHFLAVFYRQYSSYGAQGA